MAKQYSICPLARLANLFSDVHDQFPLNEQERQL